MENRKKNNGILEETSPNSPFINHQSSIIIHHSSFIISSISTSPKFLRSPFFQTAKLLQTTLFVELLHFFKRVLQPLGGQFTPLYGYIMFGRGFGLEQLSKL